MIEQGSFRGVPFAVATSSDAVGRRVATHEFIARDNPYVEDLGKAPRIIKFSAFVASDDWRSERDALQNALDEAGPGTLVHPWYGTFTVSLRSASVSHAGTVSNMATFELEFVRVTEISGPTPTINAAAVITSRADAASVYAATRFVERLNLDGVGDYVRESLASAMQTLFDSVESYTGVDVSAVSSAFDDLREDSSGLAMYAAVTGGSLATDLVDLFYGVSYAQGSTDQGIDPSAMVSLATASPVVEWVEGTGVMSQYATANAMAVADLQREMAVVESLRLAGSWTPTSAQEAATLRASLLDAVDELLYDMHDTPTYTSVTLASDSCTSDTYDSIMSLRAASLSALATAARQAPDVVTIPLTMHAQSMPSLALVYKMTGSIDTESDFVTRNNIANPLFVSAGQDLEVLYA